MFKTMRNMSYKNNSYTFNIDTFLWIENEMKREIK